MFDTGCGHRYKCLREGKPLFHNQEPLPGETGGGAEQATAVIQSSVQTFDDGRAPQYRESEATPSLVSARIFLNSYFLLRAYVCI